MIKGKYARSLCVTLLLTACLLLIFGAVGGTAHLTIHFIDVGQGDSILIQTPTGAAILVDAGDSRAGKNVVVPYLEDQGIESLDLVVMTHPHFDHIGGLIPVLERYPVKEILGDGQIHTSRTYEDLLRLILAKEIPFRLARAGDEIAIAGLDEVKVLNPREPFLKGLNNNSVVLWIRYGEIACLLTGDIEAPAETRILAEGGLKEAQVLKVAHHGSGTSTTMKFLKASKPEIGIMSLGHDNPYDHPHCKTLRHLARADVQVLRTDLAGTIILVSDGMSYWILKDGEKPEDLVP